MAGVHPLDRNYQPGSPEIEVLPDSNGFRDELDGHVAKNPAESYPLHQDLYLSHSNDGSRSIFEDEHQSKHQTHDLHPDHHTETDIDGQSYDDYDWDNDDDLEGDVRFTDLNDDPNRDHNNHRRKTLARRFSPYRIVKFIITAFIGNILLSVVLLIPPLSLRYDGYYKSGDDPAAVHSRYIYDNVAAWMFWASFNIVTSWLLHFLIELVPRLVVLLVGVVWGDVNETIKGRVETFQTAKPWVKVIFYSAMSWGSWEVMFRGIFGLYSTMENGQYRAPYTETIHLVVELLFFLMLVLSLEKLLLLSISMSFHRVAYADRIQKITKAFAVIDALQDYRPKRKSFPLPSSNHQRQAVGGILNKMNDLTDGPKNHKWWSPKRKSAKDQSADKEKSKIADDLDGYYHQSNNPTKPKLSRRNSHSTFAALAQRGLSAAKIARAAMKDPISVVGKKSGLKLDINNPSEARKLARKIYFGMKADPNRTYLIPSDFYPAFPTHEIAKDAFSIFDSDGNGDISRTEVKNEIFRAYKERRALASSLHDVGHAIGRLDRILMAMAGIVFVFIALSVVGIDYSKALTSVYTIGIAAAFIFKETAGNVFDAIIMVFCTHPYDTGDRVIMENDGVDEVLVVKRMGLLVTVFTRWDGTEWFAPNSLLGQKFIINLRRSSNQFEAATVQFGWDTPLEKLDQLEEKMNLWLQTDEQRRFEPGTACVIQSLVNQQYMEIAVGMTHRENWQDWGGRWNRRTAFHAALTYYSRELGITFYNSEQPIEFKNLNEFKERLLSTNDVDQLHYLDEEEELDDGLGDDEAESVLNNKPTLNSSVRPSASQQLRLPKGESGPTTNDKKKVPSIFTTATSRGGGDGELDRMPETLGFSAPPESGTGMRKRKKISKKKAMLGDS